MTRASPSRVLPPVALALALLGAGCMRADRSALFAPRPDADLGPPTGEPAGVRPTIPGDAPEAEVVDGRMRLSLEAATVLALRRNRELDVRQLAPVVAGAFEAIERGVFDPEVFAELRHFEESSSEVSRSTSDQFNVEGDENLVAAGIRQRLPTGTEVEASVEQERTASNRAPEQQRARIGVSLTQSLLRGLGPGVNLARVRQAELGARASLHELRGFVEALVGDLHVAYWELVLAREEIAIFEESLDLARRQLAEVEERIGVGVLPELEAATARAEVARREQALIDAQSLLEERRLRLLRLVGADAGELGAVQVLPTTPLALDPEPLEDAAERVELARARRPELGEARLRLEQERLETVVTRNGLLPRLDLFVALGRTGYSDTFLGSFRELDGDTYDLTAGLEFRHFLGNRTALGRDLAARATRRQAAAAVANLEQLVALDVRLALNEVERARRQISASRTTRELQSLSLAAEQERFGVGAGTGLLVAQAQRDLLAARIAEAEAVVQYRVAVVRLHRAEGTLLDRSGIAAATDR